jgi:hypothetical protein
LRRGAGERFADEENPDAESAEMSGGSALTLFELA